MKSTKEILEQRDLDEYTQHTSTKAMEAREIAIRIQYFLPYFKHPESNEEDNVLGYIFGHKVIL